MKQVNIRKEVLIWIILLIPFMYAATVWNKVPAQVATHFNFKGEPDDYSSKAFALLLVPVINVIIYFMFYFLPRIDPRKKNYHLFGNSYQNMRLVIHLFLAGIFIFITQTTSGSKPLPLNIFLSGMLLFFALLGNYMRTVRSNFFVGIKTPWTLSSDVVWRKTHELGGRVWFYCGMVLAIVVFFLPPDVAGIVMGAGLLLMVLVPVIYSYLAYRKLAAH